MAQPLGIDHAVIAVRDLDAAAASFTSLGFTLTPRGFHSIGSQNHCIMLRSTYIELLAAPVAHPWLDYYRAFLDRHGDGLAAVALSTDDAEATYQQLKRQGVPAGEPMDLSRPVQGGVARFRLVQINDALFVCQHLTRERVWRPEWQTHANGAGELTSIAWRAKQTVPIPDIEWQSAPALRISGLREPLEAHGVRLEPA